MLGRTLGTAFCNLLMALVATGAAAAGFPLEARAACGAGSADDRDGDGVCDSQDNCVCPPEVAGSDCAAWWNPDQEDYDEDDQGDACDADDDGDGILEPHDNCPLAWNQDQANLDQDLCPPGSDLCVPDDLGDACDPDQDGDGIPTDYQANDGNPGDHLCTHLQAVLCDDNCPEAPNPDQADADGDGPGDACDDKTDADYDGLEDPLDNCPKQKNPGQEDTDLDGLGDACDGDWDNDAVPNAIDNCPKAANPGQSDLDTDAMGDLCDTDPDADGKPSDGNQNGWVGDKPCVGGQANCDDNCPLTPNSDQLDDDQDGDGNPCDDDDDGDQLADGSDNCQWVANPDQVDTDGDTQGDACDTDDDQDGVLDWNGDNCPLTPNPDQQDSDADKLGDACDPDDDGDGLAGAEEESAGCDPAVTDTDGDGFSDTDELTAGTACSVAADFPGHRRPEGSSVAGGSYFGDLGCGQGGARARGVPLGLAVLLGALLYWRRKALGLVLALGIVRPVEAAGLDLLGARVHGFYDEGFGVQTSPTVGELSFGVGLAYHNLVGPAVRLRYVEDQAEKHLPVLDDVSVLVPALAFGIIDRLQLSAELPIALAATVGADFDADPDPAGAVQGQGVGDLYLDLKVKLLDRVGEGLGLAVAVCATAPTGRHQSLRGYPHPTAGIRAILDGRVGFFSYAVNAGFTYRHPVQGGQDPATTYGSVVEWGGLVRADFYRDYLAFFAGAVGEVQVQGPLQSPIEILAGLESRLGRVKVGVGASLAALPAPGLAPVTIMAVVGFRLSDPKNRDGDLQADDADACPSEPEDVDAYQDEDGCPEADNDSDDMRDGDDRCPQDPEDRDGFEDQDGCPDPDNDGDGVPDVVDRCPLEPETHNDYQDADGCPDEAPPMILAGYGEAVLELRFEPGSAVLPPDAPAVLDPVVRSLEMQPATKVRIEGHLGSGDPKTADPLTQARAAAVVAYLVGQGIAADRLSAVGHGLDRPIHDSGDLERNTRIELHVTAE
jgi:outer membrane protein OmpA-like peptidoglycan-associated protein